MHHPPNIKKEETPQVLPRSQASQVSATRSLYFILLNFMCLVKQFLVLYSVCRCHLSYTIILQWEWVFGLHPDHWNRFKVSAPTLYKSFLIMHDNFRIYSFRYSNLIFFSILLMQIGVIQLVKVCICLLAVGRILPIQQLFYAKSCKTQCEFYSL